VLAVADGHGSERYVRSDVGSKIATQVMVELGCAFAEPASGDTLVSLKSIAEDVIPRKLAREWRDRVDEHLRTKPLSEDEQKRAGIDPYVDDEDAVVVYGTTLLGAVITEQVLVCWQLGDGDILLMSHGGEVTTPLAPSQPEIGVDTESLVERGAWRQVRTYWSPVEGDSTELVVLSTDGLKNSFTSDEDFHAFGSGMLERLREHGSEQTRSRLPAWLDHATSYSGDDVTVAAAWNLGRDEPVGETSRRWREKLPWLK
jgi:serine/threonine protein phosphatase PrpC